MTLTAEDADVPFDVMTKRLVVVSKVTEAVTPAACRAESALILFCISWASAAPDVYDCPGEAAPASVMVPDATPSTDTVKVSFVPVMTEKGLAVEGAEMAVPV